MEKEFVCKFCNRQFPSGKSLGGHIRIHSPKNNKKRLVDQREITTPPKQQQECRVCGKSFCSLKALANHMSCHSDEGEKMDTQSAASETTTTTTSSGPTPTMMKRSKNQSNSGSFGLVSLPSDSDIDQGAKGLMFLHLGRERYNLDLNSFAESSENKSEILETKSSSGEQLKTDKVAVAADDDTGSSDSDNSDYFMNGPRKSDSDISVGGSLTNTRFGSFGFNSFNNGDELGVKEGVSKYELSKSKRVSPSYESDSSADTNSKIHRSSDGKYSMVKKASGADKNRKRHECPVCFKVYSSGQALGGHKRSHTIADQQHRIKHNAADMKFDLNLPSQDDDDE